VLKNPWRDLASRRSIAAGTFSDGVRRADRSNHCNASRDEQKDAKQSPRS